MGLLGKVRGKVNRGLKRVKAGLKHLSPEARPAGHPPMYEGHAPKPPPPAPATQAPASGEGDYWYLQGEHDGWDETNPGETWKGDGEGD